MGLLQLLVDMVDNQALRKAFFEDPKVILDAYQVTDPAERAAATHADEKGIASALKGMKPIANVGEKPVTIVFCGVMKGIGHGGGGRPAVHPTVKSRPTTQRKKKKP